MFPAQRIAYVPRNRKSNGEVVSEGDKKEEEEEEDTERRRPPCNCSIGDGRRRCKSKNAATEMATAACSKQRHKTHLTGELGSDVADYDY